MPLCAPRRPAAKPRRPAPSSPGSGIHADPSLPASLTSFSLSARRGHRLPPPHGPLLCPPAPVAPPGAPWREFWASDFRVSAPPFARACADPVGQAGSPRGPPPSRALHCVRKSRSAVTAVDTPPKAVKPPLLKPVKHFCFVLFCYSRTYWTPCNQKSNIFIEPSAPIGLSARRLVDVRSLPPSVCRERRCREHAGAGARARVCHFSRVAPPRAVAAPRGPLALTSWGTGTSFSPAAGPLCVPTSHGTRGSEVTSPCRGRQVDRRRQKRTAPRMGEIKMQSR